MIFSSFLIHTKQLDGNYFSGEALSLGSDVYLLHAGRLTFNGHLGPILPPHFTGIDFSIYPSDHVECGGVRLGVIFGLEPIGDFFLIHLRPYFCPSFASLT